MNKRVLYVDADAHTASTMLYALTELEPEWEVVHAPDAQSARARLQQESFDAVVADLSLPQAGGARLLDEATHLQPRALRFLLADLGNQSILLKCLGTAHQFLARPCDADSLQAALRRAFTLDLWLPNEEVIRLLGEMKNLPSLPDLYFKVVKALRSPDSNLEEIGELIARDPAMTAKVLQAVNSGVFGLSQSVSHPAQAVLYLGAEAARTLILLAHTYSYFDHCPGGIAAMEQKWRHSLATGRYARWIAEEEETTRAFQEEAYTAGVLHDIGKLVMEANLAAACREIARLAQAGSLEEWEAEQEVLGVNHAEVGACLAAVWGLPAGIVEALALHHHPTLVVSQGFSPLAAVHAANAIEHALAQGLKTARLDLDYLARLGLADRAEHWREVCQSRSTES